MRKMSRFIVALFIMGMLGVSDTYAQSTKGGGTASGTQDLNKSKKDGTASGTQVLPGPTTGTGKSTPQIGSGTQTINPPQKPPTNTTTKKPNDPDSRSGKKTGKTVDTSGYPYQRTNPLLGGQPSEHIPLHK